MRKLTIAEKLTITNLLYIVPIVALTYFMYDARTNDIRFAEQEMLGNRLQSPAEKVLEALSRSRIDAQRALNGEKVELATSQRKVDESLSLLKEGLDRHGVQLKFSPEELRTRKSEDFSFDRINQKWLDLRSRLSSLKAAESNDSHAAVIAGLRGMISYLGNTSNLILDPDLDTYYLTDSTLGALPSLQDRVQDVTVIAEPIARSGKPSVEDRLRLAIASSQIKADLDRITGDIQTAITEDENFNGKSDSFQREVPPAVKQLSEDVGALITQVDELAKGNPVKVEAFLSAAEKSLLSSYNAWKVAATEDDILLGKRIHALKATRLKYVVMGMIILLLAGSTSLLVGRSLRNGLMSSLQGAVKELLDSAQKTTETGRQILINSESLSSAATQQAAALQETVSALTEINAMVGKSRDNATHSVEVVGKSQESAIKGKKAVDNMVGAIGEISKSNESILKQTEESNKKIEDIVRVINEIGTKTKVINDIVFQTKLLSFNASVEAARAGEHGKGFAVVAEEVGNLAQMSGNAAKEISDLLITSTQTVTSIVAETKSKIESLVEQAKSKIDDGKRTANDCGDVLTHIVTSVEEVTNLVNEIATAATEQARGVDEITKAMHQLDEVTQTNTRMSSETNAHASSLSDQAGNLQRVVKQIESEVMGGAASKPSDSSPKPSNVLQFPAQPSPAPQVRRKKAVGENDLAESNQTPTENDPRFEDA